MDWLSQPACGRNRYVPRPQTGALGCQVRTTEAALRLLDRFLVEQHVPTTEAITPDVINAFLASRPRPAPRSYNHLLGTVTRLFDWLCARDLVARSPVQAKPRRTPASRVPFLFDPPTARRLLDVAGGLPDTHNTPYRGPTYRTIFALLYGLGLRVGEAARLRIGDVDLARQVLVVRETKFAKSRLVPFGPRMGQLVADYLDRRTPAPRTTRTSRASRSSRSVKGSGSRRAPSARCFTSSWANSPCPPRRHQTALCAQPASLVCRRHPVAVVPERRRSRVTLAPAGDVHGSRQSRVDRGLSDHHDRAPDGSQSAV
jgi:integrase